MMEKIKRKYLSLPVQVRASLWFLVCSFLQKGISVITTPIFTRLLSTAEYGQYNVFNSWHGIVNIFVSLMLTGGVYHQGLVKFEEDRKVYSSSLQGLSLTLTVFWTIIYLLFRDFWNNLFSLTTVQMLAMLVMIWATAAFNFWAAEQRVLYRYRSLVIITLIISVLKPTVGIFLVRRATDKVTARILGLALVELIGYTGLFFIQVIRGKKLYSAKYWRHALLFNLPLIPHYLSQTVLNSSDRIMIERMVGASAAGIYSLSYSVSMIMTLFNTALMSTMSPWIYQKIKTGRIRDIASVAYISLIGIVSVNLLLILFAPEVITFFAPPAYHEAIWVIPPVAMSVFFTFSYDLFAKFAFYYEKTSFVMIASVIGAVLNLILNYIFIKQFGYVAAGYTTLVCYIVYSLGHYAFMRRICRQYCEGVMPYNSMILLLIAGIFLMLGFAALLTYQTPVIRYSAAVLLLIMIFVFRNRLISAIKMLRSK